MYKAQYGLDDIKNNLPSSCFHLSTLVVHAKMKIQVDDPHAAKDADLKLSLHNISRMFKWDDETTSSVYFSFPIVTP